MIEINIRIVAEQQQLQDFKEAANSVFKDFYKKYQEFDNVLIEEETSEAVDRISEKMLDGVLEAYSICFMSFQTQRKKPIGNGRRSSLRVSDLPEQYSPDRHELIRVTFEELQRRISADDRELELVYSMVEIRKSCVKDLLKLVSSSEREAQAQYLSNEHSEQITSSRVGELEELIDSFELVCRLQEKLKPRRNEPIAVVLKLSVCEVSSEVVIHHVMFAEMGEFTRQSSSFEEEGVMELLDRFLQGRPSPENKHKLIEFFEGLLIETSQLSMTVYAGISDIPEQHQLLGYLSQLKLHASISMMNGRSQEENTTEMIQKLTSDLSILRTKVELEVKTFREKIRLMEDMLGTSIDVDRIGTKGFLADSSRNFRRQKQAVQAMDGLRKANVDQQRRLQEAWKQLKLRKTAIQKKHSKNAAVVKQLKQQIRMLEGMVNYSGYCMEQKRSDLQEREELQLKRLNESRQKRLRDYSKFADKLNKTNKQQYRSKTRQQNHKELSVCSRTVLEGTDDFSRLLAEYVEDNRRLVERVRGGYQTELQQYQHRLAAQAAKRTSVLTIHEEMSVLHEIYRQYRHNQELLSATKKQLPADRMASRLIAQAGQLDLQKYPLLGLLPDMIPHHSTPQH